MSITFKSKHSPDILMLEAIALELLKKTGHSGTVPGSFGVDDVAAALASLQAAIARGEAQHAPRDEQDEDRDDGPAVSLSHRALPLIKMLETALAERDYVIWDR